MKLDVIQPKLAFIFKNIAEVSSQINWVSKRNFETKRWLMVGTIINYRLCKILIILPFIICIPVDEAFFPLVLKFQLTVFNFNYMLRIYK